MDQRNQGSDGVGTGKPLRELARLFLKLGVIGFGGPAAHIPMMEEEVVGCRRWITREHFLDLVGATNLIPGPNSTEMAIHVGYLRAGWPGLAIAGIAFLLPAVLITAGFAWAYVQFGSLPQVAPFLFGIKPALIAVILGGVIGMLWLGRAAGRAGLACLPAAAATGIGAASAATIATGGGGTAITVSLVKLGLFFLKVGAVLYGSGYVLVAFFEGGSSGITGGSARRSSWMRSPSANSPPARSCPPPPSSAMSSRGFPARR